MALNGIVATSDPLWAGQAEREIAELKQTVATLVSQMNNLNRG